MAKLDNDLTTSLAFSDIAHCSSEAEQAFRAQIMRIKKRLPDTSLFDILNP